MVENVPHNTCLSTLARDSYLDTQSPQVYLTHFTKVRVFLFTIVAFFQLDGELLILGKTGQLFDTEGSTATIALLLNDDLYVSYIGDSSAILIGNGGKTVTNLCPEIDTASDNTKEVERIEKAGGVVLKVGKTIRVQGELALTRSFGDSRYKQYVISEPHITQHKLKNENKHEFLVMASDGLWNSLTAVEVAHLVTEMKEEPENEIAERLHAEAMKRNCTDNITIAVINLEKRLQLQKEAVFTVPAAPTSRRAKENKKSFSFLIE